MNEVYSHLQSWYEYDLNRQTIDLLKRQDVFIKRSTPLSDDETPNEQKRKRLKWHLTLTDTPTTGVKKAGCISSTISPPQAFFLMKNKYGRDSNNRDKLFQDFLPLFVFALKL